MSRNDAPATPGSGIWLDDVLEGEIVRYIVTQSSTTMSYEGETSANSVCALQDCSSRRRWHHDQTNTVTSSPRLRSSIAQFTSLAAWVPISPFFRFPSFEFVRVCGLVHEAL